MAYGLLTYDDGSRRESLLSILRDVSPNTDHYLVSNLGVAPAATNTLHEWTTYNTARPTSITFTIEGADASYSDLTQPVRTNNVTAIITEAVKVSATERAISTATKEDPWVFQKAEALKRLKAKMEFALINGTRASGSSGVARGMTGIDGMISTNLTARASGTTFTETELNDIMQDSWDQVGQDYVADMLLCPMTIKRRISTFTANNTRNIDASSKRLDAEVRVYDSNVGKTVMIVPHKDVRNGVASGVYGSLTVYALREDTWKMAFLTGREPKWEELAKSGDYDCGQYVTELALVGYAQRASVKRYGYLPLS
jgi:hypothetical protein